MAKKNSNFKFTNPNSEEAVFKMLIKLLAKANKPIIDEAVNTALAKTKNTAEPDGK